MAYRLTYWIKCCFACSLPSCSLSFTRLMCCSAGGWVRAVWGRLSCSWSFERRARSSHFELSVQPGSAGGDSRLLSVTRLMQLEHAKHFIQKLGADLRWCVARWALAAVCCHLELSNRAQLSVQGSARSGSYYQTVDGGAMGLWDWVVMVYCDFLIVY